MSRASQIVAEMLDEPQDAHIKARDRVQKWDNVHSTYGHLKVQRQQLRDVESELGRSIAYHRALAHLGLSKDDVARVFYGSQISATDNYKRQTPVKTCKTDYCAMRGKPVSSDEETCRSCSEPLQTTMKATAPSDLRGKLARHIVGIEAKDGRKFWFDEPVPPKSDFY